MNWWIELKPATNVLPSQACTVKNDARADVWTGYTSTPLRLPLNLGSVAIQHHCRRAASIFELKLLCCNCSTLRKRPSGSMREERKENSQGCTSAHALSLVSLPLSTTAPGHRCSLHIIVAFEYGFNNRVILVLCTRVALTMCVRATGHHFCSTFKLRMTEGLAARMKDRQTHKLLNAESPNRLTTCCRVTADVMSASRKWPEDEERKSICLLPRKPSAG